MNISNLEKYFEEYLTEQELAEECDRRLSKKIIDNLYNLIQSNYTSYEKVLTEKILILESANTLIYAYKEFYKTIITLVGDIKKGYIEFIDNWIDSLPPEYKLRYELLEE